MKISWELKKKKQWQTTAAKAVLFGSENIWHAVKEKLQEPDFK